MKGSELIIEKKFYTGRYDIVFKSIICDEDSPHMLKIFLSSILNIEIEEIIKLDNELTIDGINEKRMVVDVLVKTKEKYIHVELNNTLKEYTRIRNFCYFTNIYNHKIKKGETYNINDEFIHIDLSYGINDNECDIRNYYVMDERHNMYINNFKIIEFNMDKISKYWYIKDKEKIDEFKYLIMLDLNKVELSTLSKDDDFVKEYEDKLVELNERETFQSYMTIEEDQKVNYNTDIMLARNAGMAEGKLIGIEEGKLEGIEEGKLIGIKEGKIESTTNIAISLHNKNYSVEQISEILDCELDYVEKLINNYESSK